MISIVIRNKNEGKALEHILFLLTTQYPNEFDEIVLVDNESIDDSIEIAEKYHCKIIQISNFTYGRAINMGIEVSKNNCILLLSAHAMPVGTHFFSSILQLFQKFPDLAGIRFINSFENYQRACEHDFEVKDGLRYGLMAACAVVNKKVWERHNFDEELVASEDKEWSQRVIDVGYKIYDLNETYFYFIKRSDKGNLKRWKIETLAYYQLRKMSFPSYFKIILSFIKKILIKNPITLLKTVYNDIQILLYKFEIKKSLREK